MEVHPDLPPARTTAGALFYHARRMKDAVFKGRYRSCDGQVTTATTSAISGSADGPSVKDGERFLVRSVPVQMSQKEVRCGFAA